MMKNCVAINHLAILVCFVHYSTSTSPNVLQKFEAIKFDVLPGHVLSVSTSEVTQNTIKVPDKKDCVASCTDVPWCRSVNAKITPESDGRYLCEVMSTDKYTHKKNLKQDHSYIHFSMKNPCEKGPCPNYTVCHTVQGNRQLYSCLCKKGFTGNTCEIEIDYCKSAPCLNGASCYSNLDMSRYECTCTEGFLGTNCQLKYHKESAMSGQAAARATCQTLGSDLPTVHSAEDNENVKQLVLKVDKWIWLGLHDPTNSGSYANCVWIDGKPVNYTNWNPNINGESGACVLMDGAGLWHVHNCAYSNGVGCFIN